VGRAQNVLGELDALDHPTGAPGRTALGRSRIRRRPRPHTLTRHDAESPELTLVSPELREEARRRLPDRPWEVPLQAGGTEARDARARVQPPPEQAARHAPPGPRQPGSPVEHRPRTARLARWLPVAAVAIGGLVLWMPWQGSRIAGTDEVVGREPPLPSASPAPGAARHARLLGNAGYVVSPSGSFLTNASGRRIRSFTLPVRCGAQPLVIRAVPISGASFRFTGKAVGRAAVVELSGRVLDRTHVRGRVGARGPSCRAGAIPFSARVS